METETRREPNAVQQTGRARDAPCKARRRAAAAAVLAVILLALLLWLRPWAAGSQGGLTYETNVVVGELPGKTAAERQAELDQLVEEGMLSMSINATPSASLSRDGGKVNWLIENPSNQGKLIRVEVYRTDNGDKIYETGALRPGSYVESAPLQEKLAPGEYSCTAVFYTYQIDTEAYIGQAAAEVTLLLQE